MTYSFTEKKRIRKDFSKLPETREIPFLLATQLDSYRASTTRARPTLRGNCFIRAASFRIGETGSISNSMRKTISI